MVGGADAFTYAGTRMFAGIAGGAAIAASRASAKDPNLIDDTTLDKTLETAIEACHKALRDYLSLAVGGGGDDSLLPNQRGDYDSPIANFFHDGE